MSPFAAVTAVISVVVSAMALHSVSSSLLFALIAARRLRSPSSRRMIVRFTAATASATIAAEPSTENAETETAALVQQSFLSESYKTRSRRSRLNTNADEEIFLANGYHLCYTIQS